MGGHRALPAATVGSHPIGMVATSDPGAGVLEPWAALILVDDIDNPTEFDIQIRKPDDSGLLSLMGLIPAAPVSSVFGRTGAITAEEGDYVLDELGDVTLGTPSAGEFLRFDGAVWVNALITTGDLGSGLADNTRFLRGDSTWAVPNEAELDDLDSRITALEGVTGAPADADYLVKSANGTLSAERVVTDTTTITWDWSVAGQAKAQIPSSVALAGDPTTTTQLASDDSTRIATTAFVQDVIDALRNGVSAAFDTLAEIETALNLKATIASPTFTGDPKAPTPAADDNDTSIATTAYVQTELLDFAPKASPTFTGNPVAPTPSFGDNDTSIATTAFVQAALDKQKEVIMIAVTDESTAITTGTPKVTFRMPFAMTLTEVRASLNTASSSGNPAIDINEDGVSILSTVITIDSGAKTSTIATTPPVISDSSLADDAEMTIDIDTAGTGAKGLKVYLIGTRA